MLYEIERTLRYRIPQQITQMARRLKHLAIECDISLQALGVEAFQRLPAGK